MGTGHYTCKQCVYYRADFKKYGQDYIDWFFMRIPIYIKMIK